MAELPPVTMTSGFGVVLGAHRFAGSVVVMCGHRNSPRLRHHAADPPDPSHQLSDNVLGRHRIVQHH
jgi:hypothetical protein